MKKATGVTIGVLAIGGVALASKLISRKSKMEVAEEMVRHWSPIILEELGLGNAENILDKITVSEKVLDTPTLGEIFHTQQHTYFSLKATYVPNTSKISIYAKNMNYIHLGGNKRIKNPGMFGKNYRRALLFTLAHELRHFWQLRTGEYYNNSLMLGGKQLMSYEHQWIEKDANKFAAKFVTKYKNRI